jgi:menaquinone-dependent protoporphyrinogen oxidase
MKRLLVAYASKHGSTAEIAEAIGEALRARGDEVEVRPAAEVRELSGVEGVVIGSALYMGRWMREGVEFLKRHERTLRDVPTWLFSSGPTGGTPDADAKVREMGPVATGRPVGNVARLADRIYALGHVTFPGRVVPEMGGMFARWVPRGDWRDFGAIRTWAGGLFREPGKGSQREKAA